MVGKNCYFLSLLILLLTIPFVAFSQESENVNLNSEHFWAWEKPTGSAFLVDDYLNYYLALSTGRTGLGILDISDGSHPEHISNYETDIYAYEVAGNWPFVILGEENNIRVIDISNPENPIETGSLVLDGRITILEAVNDTIYYASGEFPEMYVVNIADPYQPLLSNTLTFQGTFNDIDTNDTLLVICTSEENGLYDISDPINPLLYHQFTEFSGSEKAALSDEYLAIYSEGTFRTYELLTHESPFLGVVVEEEWKPCGWYGNELHVLAGNHLKIIGIINNGGLSELFSHRCSMSPTNPEETYHLDVIGYEMSYTTGYLLGWKDLDAYENTVEILFINPISLSHPRSPWIGEYYADFYKMFSSVRKDNFIYIASSNADVRILEILDDQSIIEHESINNGYYDHYVTDITVFGNKLFTMGTNWPEFAIYQAGIIDSYWLSNPTRPVFDDNLTNRSSAVLNVGDDYFVTNPSLLSDNYLSLYIQYPLQDSTFSARIRWEENESRLLGYSTILHNGYVYTSYNWDRNTRNGFFTIQLEEDGDIHEIDSFHDVEGHAMELVIDGEREILYLCNGNEGINLYSLQNNPLRPAYLTNIQTGGFVKYIEVHDEYIFIVNEDIGLEVYDVTDIQSPVLTGWFYDVGVFNHVEVVDSVAQLTSDRHFYLLDCINAMGGTSGVEEELTEIVPQEHIIYPPYPNPFNSSTQVKVDLDSPSRVTIKAYDILGRELYRETKFLQKGHHTIPINLKENQANLSSGPILVRVETSKSNQVYKIYHLE